MTTQRNDAQPTDPRYDDLQRDDVRRDDVRRDDLQSDDVRLDDVRGGDVRGGELPRDDFGRTDQPRFEQAGDPAAARTQSLSHDEFATPAEQPVADQTMGAPLGMDEPVGSPAHDRVDDGAAAWSDTSRTASPTPASNPVSTDEAAGSDSLFAGNDLSGLRSRWDDVQAGFVDDPRMCVQKADGLVSDVVDQLTDGFSHARAQLEEQWARGEEVSTEDLRLALTRYREFFQRLLAV